VWVMMAPVAAAVARVRPATMQRMRLFTGGPFFGCPGNDSGASSRFFSCSGPLRFPLPVARVLAVDA
jgi:hypothetical protein